MKINLRKRISAGFTLIELLVVVAIIGILASIVLVSLGTARNKGLDSSIKENLHTVANQAELFFIDNNNSYLPAGGVAIGIITPCSIYMIGGDNMFKNNKVLALALAEATKNGNGNACYNSSTAWVVAVGLKTTSGTYWCIDNSGTAKQTSAASASATINNAGACI